MHQNPLPADLLRTWQDQGRKQLFLLRMIYFGEREWHRLGVPRAYCQTVADDEVAPAFHSSVFWQHLDVKSLQSVDDAAVRCLHDRQRGAPVVALRVEGVGRGAVPRGAVQELQVTVGPILPEPESWSCAR